MFLAGTGTKTLHVYRMEAWRCEGRVYIMEMKQKEKKRRGEEEARSRESACGQEEILFRQSRLGMTFFAVSMMVITTFQWIMLDMYLPALPVLKSAFGVSESVLNISINTGIVATAAGTLVSGPLSDRFGRKCIMLIGLLTSGLSALACGLAQGIILLCIMRGIGGLGSGFAMTVANAMLKDSFCGRTFQRYMTAAQSVSVIGPIVAPSLGAMIINVSSWRFIFVFLAAGTILTSMPVFISDETWPKEKRTAVNFLQMKKEFLGVVRSRGFLLFLGIMAFLTIPVWAYISVSSYIYITDFGLSNLQYGLFYAFGSITSFFGPILYIQLNKLIRSARIVTIAIVLVFTGGAEFLFTGRLSPVLFLLAVIPIMLSEGMIRPLGLVVLLEENAAVVGTASALINFVVNVVGILGTSFATLGWRSQILGTGVISLLCGTGAVICWCVIVKKRMLKRKLSL